MASMDHCVDFLVVGSGAAGMSGALRAHALGKDVLVVEKAEVVGGSTAMSGRVCWVGDNPSMHARGCHDSPDEVLAYLRAITKGTVPDAMLVAYRDESLRMLAFLEGNTHVRFDALEQYVDYYAESPGGKLGGRSMEPRAFDASLLGAEFARLRKPPPSALVLGKAMLSPREAQPFVRFGLRSFLFVIGFFARYALRFRRRARAGGRDTALAQGAALVGRLFLSMIERGIPIWYGERLTDLIVEEGRVVGAAFTSARGTARVRARKGVLLACGGFERNLAMRQAYGPAPAATTWSVSAETNTGDGIEAGARLGGALALMDDAWWTPVTQYPGADSGWVLLMEKSLPGSIFVDRDGDRYMNEAAPYGDVVKAMYAHHTKTGRAVPGFMIFDARYRRYHLAGPVAHGIAMPDSALPRRLRESFLVKGSSIAELAARLEMAPERLAATIARFNGFARAGRDEDFGRGEHASDRYYSDPSVGANPCLAPLETAPYYAIPIYPGDLGTKGGLVTDTGARVLRADGAVIDGLYAAGNTMASVMGPSYPGAGGTIGPALTFGFVAANSACDEAARALTR